MTEGNKQLLEIENLKVHFRLDEGLLKAVDGVNLTFNKGQVLGVVGESGCGKSVTSQAILRIVPPIARLHGSIRLFERGGERLDPPLELTQLKATGREIRGIRGKEISMIFQEPMAAFSPIHTIGNQMVEALRLHKVDNAKRAKELAEEMLAKVGISNPAQRIDEYPHQISGGMRQRAMIAMALSCDPNLLIADEPTTALDVTVQAQVLELMKNLQAEIGMSILYITHDLGVIAEMADEVAVMYLGRVVEYLNVDDLFFNSYHPYTKALLRSIPKVGTVTRERLDPIEGTVPLPLNLPPMCSFYDRCPEAIANLCNKEQPPLIEMEKRHHVSCFLYTQPQQDTARLRGASYGR